MYNYFLLTLTALAVIAPVQVSAQTPPIKVTDVMVTLTVKPGVTRDQIVKAMHDEVSATVRLYLDGKVRQWYSRADGKGVVFILACGTVEEAKTMMEKLPLAKLNVMDYGYMGLAPLQPLNFLLADAPARQ